MNSIFTLQKDNLPSRCRIKANSNKVLLITNIPTPYRIPLFNELNKQLECYGIKLKVFFGSLGYARRRWVVNMSECMFDYEVLPSKNIRYSDSEKSSFTYAGLYCILSKENPSLVISNGFSIATTKLWWRFWFRHTPYLIWSGDIHREDQSSSLLRRLQRKLLSRRALGFIAYGTKAKEYLVSLGAFPGKVQIAVNTVDTNFYATQIPKLQRNLTSKQGKKRLLCVGHLSSRKNVLSLIKIIHVLSKSRSDFVLDIVGDGEDSIRLKNYVRDNRLTDFVTFHGYKQASDMPRFMAQADCFLFPTNFDIWGLVLNEAMAAGLLCMASKYAGATYDLINDGVTGFAMDFSQTEKVTDKINWVLENPYLAKQIGQNASRFMAENAGLEKSAAGFVKAIITAMKKDSDPGILEKTALCTGSSFGEAPSLYQNRV